MCLNQKTLARLLTLGAIAAAHLANAASILPTLASPSPVVATGDFVSIDINPERLGERCFLGNADFGWSEFNTATTSSALASFAVVPPQLRTFQIIHARKVEDIRHLKPLT